MKKLTCVKLRQKVVDMYNFMEDCKQYEINSALANDDTQIIIYHQRREQVFQFMKDYIQNNFRPLV